MTLENAAEAADLIHSKTELRPRIAIVLGSGLGAFADELEDAVSIPYEEIPHFVRSTVEGHRMGTMEIESALVAKTDLVAEAAVVGRPDDLTGEAIVAFVVLKRPVPTGEEAKQLANELRNWVAKEIGPIAKPKDIRFGENLPKTRSGKIMRRLLRSLAKGESITQDTSTLENPAILDQLAHTN